MISRNQWTDRFCKVQTHHNNGSTLEYASNSKKERRNRDLEASSKPSQKKKKVNEKQEEKYKPTESWVANPPVELATFDTDRLSSTASIRDTAQAAAEDKTTSVEEKLSSSISRISKQRRIRFSRILIENLHSNNHQGDKWNQIKANMIGKKNTCELKQPTSLFTEEEGKNKEIESQQETNIGSADAPRSNKMRIAIKWRRRARESPERDWKREQRIESRFGYRKSSVTKREEKRAHWKVTCNKSIERKGGKRIKRGQSIT